MTAVNYMLGKAEDLLVGRTIVSVRLMTDDEMRHFGWKKRSVVIELDDSTRLVPSTDDEMNDAGSLVTDLDELPILFSQ